MPKYILPLSMDGWREAGLLCKQIDHLLLQAAQLLSGRVPMSVTDKLVAFQQRRFAAIKSKLDGVMCGQHPDTTGDRLSVFYGALTEDGIAAVPDAPQSRRGMQRTALSVNEWREVCWNVRQAESRMWRLLDVLRGHVNARIIDLLIDAPQRWLANVVCQLEGEVIRQHGPAAVAGMGWFGARPILEPINAMPRSGPSDRIGA